MRILGLLTAAEGVDAGERQEVGHPEVAGPPEGLNSLPPEEPVYLPLSERVSPAQPSLCPGDDPISW